MNINNIEVTSLKKNNLFKIILFFLLLAVFAGINIQKKNLIPASSTPLTKKTIIIDAGHGFPDSGTSSKSGISESDINLKIAKKLKKLLSKSKVKVIMTRKDENSLSESKTNNKQDDLKKRAKIRDNSNADMFISIHLNHFGEPQYYGAQVFYSSNNDENQKLAESVQKKLIELADPSNTRKVKSTNDIYILKNAQIPSVLIECGFLSNPDEAEKLNTDEYQQKLVWAIYCGIADYFEENSHL